MRQSALAGVQEWLQVNTGVCRVTGDPQTPACGLECPMYGGRREGAGGVPGGTAQHSLTTWRAVSRRTRQLRIAEPFTRAVTFPECSSTNSGPEGIAGVMAAPEAGSHGSER